MSPTARRKRAKAVIDQAVREVLGTIAGWNVIVRSAFEALVRHARRHSDLLRPPPDGRLDPGGVQQIVNGLLSLAAFRHRWVRPIGEWAPAGDNPRPQFTSLAGHLFATYPVPGFMTSVWFEATTEGARRQQWFMHIGSGRNIRTAELPLPYTKRMAHAFLQAPDHLPVDVALRWGQVRGLGGSERLAEAVVATRLGRSFEDEDFWGTVVRFLVNHPGLDPDRVGPIIDYLHDQRFVSDWQFDEARGDVDWRPRQPDLAMKGRTPRSLLRQVAEWQQGLGLHAKRPVIRWPRSGIEEFRHAEPGVPGRGGRVWMIRELLNSQALRVEGAAMHHCVATYVGLCLKRRVSIWSMTVGDRDGRRRVLTIEVDLATREVAQASRCCNERPNPKDLEILRLWAESQGLKVDCC